MIAIAGCGHFGRQVPWGAAGGLPTRASSGAVGRGGRAARPAFTLVELLVVMTIIGIMMGAVYGAVEAARTAARISRTKATITKLHHLIMARYDSYKTRRVPLDVFSVPFETRNRRPAQPRELALARLYMIRDIMRQELPERPEDCNPDKFGSTAMMSQNAPVFSVSGTEFQVPAQPLFNMYMNYWRSMVAQNQVIDPRYGPAEMLHMIVTLSCPNGRAQFTDDEIDDADGDGWPEFVDGWRNPIMFLRWAPRFSDSTIQVNYTRDSAKLASEALDRHDPFDPLELEPGAYELIPLVYSAGPDGIYDIDVGNYAYFVKDFDGKRRRPHALGTGMGIDTANFTRTGNSPANGRQEFYDNIHNHRLEN